MQQAGMGRNGLILGIESSCDETAAAVLRNGREVLSNVVASQVDMHALYGGVVPELASREHLRSIVPVVREAMRCAAVTYADLDAVAVTAGPGLAGALLVGISFAKALAFGLRKPLIAVNHLEGHIHAVLLQTRMESTGNPVLALVVSGGHTHLYLAREAEGVWHYRNIGRTVDDAAGEAFDKVAKLLGLPYPGGPWIDRLAPHGNRLAVPFRFAELNRGTVDAPTFDFSFSGIKTAVLRYTETHNMGPAISRLRTGLAASAGTDLPTALTLIDSTTLDLIASFQHAVIGTLIRQTRRAAAAHGVQDVLVSGGVAANRELRARFQESAAAGGLQVHFPPPALSTDNAAMIAAAAWPKLVKGEYAGAGLNAAPQLRLG